jgi:hypothetical protein
MRIKVYVAPGKYDEFYGFSRADSAVSWRFTVCLPEDCSGHPRFSLDPKRMGLQRGDKTNAYDLTDYTVG